MHAHHEVIVIGAGVAGLTAMRTLTAAGVDAVCLEARARVGGRLLTAQTDVGPLDLGATWLWAHERRITGLVRELGLPTFRQHADGAVLLDGRAVERLADTDFRPSLRYGSGAAAITEHLFANLPPDSVRLQTPVTALAVDGTDTLQVRTPTATLHAEQVIVAVPPALAVARIDLPPELPTRLVQVARSTPVWMGRVTKVVVRYRSPFWRDDGLSGTAFSRRGPLQEIHDMSGPHARPAALLGFVVGGSNRPDLVADVTTQLQRLFGWRAAHPEEVLVQDWSTEHWTSPSHVYQLTDFTTYGHPAYTQPTLGGRLHWAATETSTEHPGHVEGALAAAERAARAAISRASTTLTRK
ncbi:FAD-dependent oxidoreductase [Mycolicibacterium sp. lyk4-40-TYG-92]|uniref:flavin monoamine oxidase family protein n=1 Tax=Mycolicibacterium sp. lyk4-40-TYG-92 TaxID=3040295 RepID=UPI00254AE549|nr:FAD-dependent oxidoreductase [Mycolicibacterium sp. lyk4-40-TYG-92]